MKHLADDRESFCTKAADPVPIEKIRPQRDFLLVRRDPEETVSKGGIIVPDIAQGTADPNARHLRRGRGIVLARGPGARKLEPDASLPRKWVQADAESIPEQVSARVYLGAREPMDVQVGERVAFSRLIDWNLDELGHPDLVLVQECDIECVLEDGAP